MAPLTLATSAGRVFFSNYEQVVCLDLKSGKERWRSQSLEMRRGHRGTAGTLVAQQDVVLYAHTPKRGGSYYGELKCFAADSGELLWTGPRYAGPGPANAPDLFVVDDLVWVGETRIPVDNMSTELWRQGFDLQTGKVRREVTVPKLISPGHHYRCYRSKATERYLLLPKRGVEFVDLQGENHMRNDWLRAPCTYGVLPANGLLYVAPHQCVCYPGVQLAHFNALAPGDEEEGAENKSEPADRLKPGAAWDDTAGGPHPSKGDWPAYRRDARRSGSTPVTVPSKPAEQWQTQLEGELTPPVVAGGRLVVAEKDAHTVHALASDNGKRLWSFTAGGRIDSPPTVHGSLVLFGSADGRVYCLRLADGNVVWRFLAAPRDRRVTAFGQVESAWPVHGSVLVEEDITVDPPRPVAYCTAGRSSFLDGGIVVYGLDPETGRVLHRTELCGPWPDPFKDTGMAGYMNGAKTDLLVSDGTDLFMYQERFRTDLARVPAPMQRFGKEGGGFRIYPSFPERGSSGRRLITTSGFLDDAYNEGTYWTYSERWAGWDRKMGSVPSYGQLLVFDDTAVYGVHVMTANIRVRRGVNLGDKGYRLFARDHDAKKDRWSTFVPIRVRAMVLAGDKFVVAGLPDVIPDDDPLAAVDGRLGSRLLALRAADGEKLAEAQQLDAVPVFDGLIAAEGRLFLSTVDGRVMCLGE
jgi:outer membrane protein assembly factor BamB